MDTPTFLTAVDVAHKLKISKALSYRLVTEGKLPAVRFGRTVRISPESLESFIAENSSEKNPEPTKSK